MQHGSTKHRPRRRWEENVRIWHLVKNTFQKNPTKHWKAILKHFIFKNTKIGHKRVKIIIDLEAACVISLKIQRSWPWWSLIWTYFHESFICQDFFFFCQSKKEEDREIFNLIFRAVTGLGPPSGSALKPNVELELPESDLTEEMEDSGKKKYVPTYFIPK